MGNNNKLFSYLLLGLLGLSALMSLLFAVDVVSEGLLIIWCYILLAIAAITAVAFPIITMVQNPKGAKNALIGVGALILICVIGYFMSGNEVHANIDGKETADASMSQKSEAGLIAAYILGIVAIGAIIFTEVSKSFK